ncbi:IclR family transcriptional regulator domain-containing protein, partial [Streptomyces sp. NPDC001348]
ERTAPGPLFAAEWTETDWTRWRARRAADPDDTAFPAVPRTRHGSGPDEDFTRRSAQAAADGYALDDQLIEPGLVAVSVPVRDPATGRVACAANVVSHTSRHTAAGLRDTLLPRLRDAVTAMEADLRDAQPASPGPPPSGLATWTTASKTELGRGFVESLARGLTVLTAFGEGRAHLTLTEAAEATGLARATARRALITYEHLGLMTTSPDRRTFTLTPRVLSLGFPPLSRTTLPQLATWHLRALANQVGESTAMAVLVPPEPSAGPPEPMIQLTARATTPRVLSPDITVGTRFPARATSLGRALLASDPSHPYALADEELESGLRSIAVPIHDRTGQVIAAINITTHAARRTLDDCVTHLLPALTATATHIQTDLHTASRFTHVPPT